MGRDAAFPHIMDLVGVGFLECLNVSMPLLAGLALKLFPVFLVDVAWLLGCDEEADVMHLRPSPLVRDAGCG
jgi:hypothetical protein